MAFVQFKDKTEKSVIAVFGCSQPDTATWPNQGEVDDDDPRLMEFLKPATPDVV